MPLNPTALRDALSPAQALPSTPSPSQELDVDASFTALCRREAAAFQRAAKSGDDLLVACTQEQRLFLELNEHTQGALKLDERPIRFVNIRETGGWSRDAKQATPKIAALIRAASLPDPDPLPTVTYRSAGRCLVIGRAQEAEKACAMLGAELDVTVLLPSQAAGAMSQRHTHATQHGELVSLRGHLGAFEATWSTQQPIDLDLCTRCNACIAACPEAAIDFSYSVDLSRCKSHRDCVQACEAVGAIDFQREARQTTQTFDMVLDLRSSKAFEHHSPPLGYHWVGDDPVKLMQAVLALRDTVGTFDKPKFFTYKPKLCAHSRNEQTGCTACIDVCSAKAIRSDASMKGKPGPAKSRTFTKDAPVVGGVGGGIVVDPHLCVGCGACSTVCPSGALAYAAPNTVDHGRKLRVLLQTYARAGGKDAALLVHSQTAGREAIEALGRAAISQPGKVQGVPHRVIPMEVWHTASVGMDLWLSALAFGASQVWVLMTDEDAPAYRESIQAQMDVAQAILTGMGYGSGHLRSIELGGPVASPQATALLDQALNVGPAATVTQAAALAVQADKRATLDLVIEHLWMAAPSAGGSARKQETITLPAKGSPFGSLGIDREACTLCLACVGACPEAALADNPERPQLRFVEKNCVQCGLCVKTCPESALTLQPRLWMADEGKARKQLRVLNEAEPFVCIQCGKPFGTLQAVERMIAKVGQHPAFEGAGQRRLRMCNDCRVVDIFSDKNEVRITDL